MILVAGGSGYFGSALVEALLGQGSRVRIFDLRENSDRSKETEMRRGDIRDLEAVRSACRGVECVYHCVAQVPLARDKRLFDSVNRLGTENILTASLDAGVRKFVYLSSSAVYGIPKSNPVDEETPPAPLEAYGRAKLAGEQKCLEFVRRGLDATIIRPRTILGQGRLGIFQMLFDLVSQGCNVPVFGRGDNLYQFVHASDLADACIRAAGRPGPSAYNCGARKFGSMRETLEALCRHAKTGSRVRGVPMGLASGLMRAAGFLRLAPFAPYHALMYGRSLYFDVSKASRDLGWEPRYSNVEMVIEDYESYLANRESILRKGGSESRHRSAVRQGVVALLRYLL